MWLKTFGGEGLEYSMVEVNSLWIDDCCLKYGWVTIEEMCVIFLTKMAVTYHFMAVVLTSFAILLSLVFWFMAVTVKPSHRLASSSEELRYLSQRYA